MKLTPVRVRGQIRDRDPKSSRPVPIVFPTVCWDQAEALERLGGDQDLLREICGIFLEESPKLMHKLKQAIAASDSHAVMRAAHSLKGELGYLGAAAALRASRSLEDMGHDRKLSQATKVFALLERELADLHLAMRDSSGGTQ